MYALLGILIKWRKFIIISGFSAAAVAAGISLILPKWYVATASVFPPEPQSLVTTYSEIIQSLQSPILGATSLGPQGAGSIYIAILRSRKVGEQIIREFDYQRVYNEELTEGALKALHSHTFFTLLHNGLLKVSFEDRDPERAAAVANRYMELLDKFNQKLNVTRASKSKEFVAKQLAVHEGELRKAEEDLRRFQEENKAIELSEQTSATIEIVADLTGKAIALEIEMKILSRYASTSSDEYKKKKQEYDEIIDQLKKLKVYSTRDDNDALRSFFPTFDRVPDVSLELARLMRRVKVEEKVYELLVREYEQARIEEARDTPTIQILDHASVPELRSRPKRKRIVFLGGILGIAWSGFVAVLIDAWRNQKDRERTLKKLLEPAISDLARVFRRNRR